MYYLCIPNLIYFFLPYYGKYLSEYLYKINTYALLSYMISLYHSVIVSYNSINYLCYSNFNNFYITFSITYFIADLYVINNMSYLKKNKIPMTIHHIITILGGFYFHSIEFSNEKNLVYSLLSLSEISTIFFNICWYIIKFNYQYTKIYKIFNTLTKISYFIFRILNFPLLIYLFYLYEYNFLFILQIPLTILSFYWFCKNINRDEKKNLD